MWTTTFLAATLALAGVQAQQPPAPSFMLQVGTPTPFPDGVVRGATGSFGPLKVGQPVVLYVYSGKSLCLSSSPQTSVPPDAGYGWRLDVTPLRESGGLVLQVAWQRMWDRGAKLSNGLRGHAEVTLKPGGKLMFDYLGAGETTSACNAIGMGLEVGLAPSANQGPLVETELWLVGKMQDGTEVTQRQVVRQRAGEPPVPFYFDDVKLGEAPNEQAFKATGTLSIAEIDAGGKMHLSVSLAQSRPTSGAGPATSSTGFADLLAASGEVVSLPMPVVWLTRSTAVQAKDDKKLQFLKGQLDELLKSGKSEQHPDVKAVRKQISDLEVALQWIFTKKDTFSVRLRAQILR